MFGPIDESKPYTTIIVNSAVQIMPLRRAVLPEGTYRIQGDLRPKLGNIREKRKMQAGIFAIQFHPGTPQKSVSAQTHSQPTMPKAPMDVDDVELEAHRNVAEITEPKSIEEQAVPDKVVPEPPEELGEPVVADTPPGEVGVVADQPEDEVFVEAVNEAAAAPEPELPQSDPQQPEHRAPAVEEKEPEEVKPKKLRSNAKLDKMLALRGVVVSGGVEFCVTDGKIAFQDHQGNLVTKEFPELDDFLQTRVDEWYATFEEKSDEKIGEVEYEMDQDVLDAGAAVGEPPPGPTRGRFGMPAVPSEGRTRTRRRG